MLRDFFAKDTWLKLFSLLLAGVIWFTVHSAIRNETAPPSLGEIRTFQNLPVSVLKSAHDPRPLRVSPATVTVTATGKLPLLQTLTGKDIAVFINLTDALDTVGAAKTVWVRLPEGLNLLHVEPSTVRVENLTD